jgi:hypothetical protein
MKNGIFSLIFILLSVAASAQVCVSIARTAKTATTATFSFTLSAAGTPAVTDYSIYLLPTTGSVNPSLIDLRSGSNTVSLPYNMGTATVDLAAGATTVDFRLTTNLGENSAASTASGDIITVNLCNTSVVLPVEWLNFSGYTEGGNNLLVWTTANEINNKGFQVERLNCKDTRPCVSTTWESIGFVNSKGKAAMYDFTDKAPFSVSYYRLRQIDNDGKETLSKIVSLSNTAKSFLKVYPNPATDVLTVEFTKGIGTTEKATTFEVINVLGQIILRGPLNQSVDVSSLPNGTYIVRLSQLPPSLDGGGLEQVKFVKQ